MGPKRETTKHNRANVYPAAPYFVSRAHDPMMCAPTGLSNPAPAALQFAVHMAYLLGGLHLFPWLFLTVISRSLHLQHPGVPTDAHTSHSQFKTLSPFPGTLCTQLTPWPSIKMCVDASVILHSCKASTMWIMLRTATWRDMNNSGSKQRTHKA